MFKILGFIGAFIIIMIVFCPLIENKYPELFEILGRFTTYLTVGFLSFIFLLVIYGTVKKDDHTKGYDK